MMQLAVKQNFQLETETAKTYRYAVQRYQRLTNKPLTFRTLAEHCMRLRTQEYAAATIALDFNVFSKEIIDRARPDQRAALARERKQLRRTVVVKDSTTWIGKALKPSQIRRLIDAAPYRFSFILIVLAETGARVSEICGMKWSDRVEDREGVGCFKIVGKGNKARHIYLPLDIIADIRRVFGGITSLFETRHGKAYNRRYIYNQMRRLTEELLGRGLGPHTLRHSFGTNEIADGTPLDAVSEALGHSDSAFTLRVYSHNKFKPHLQKHHYRRHYGQKANGR